MIDFKSYIPFYKRNLNLALPVMVTQAGQMIVQFADNIMVGHLGTTQFAGVSFANSIFLIGMVFCICFTQGLIPHVGQNYGKGDHKTVAEFFINSFIINTIMCLSILALMIVVIPLMNYMGQDPNIIGYAKSYYAIMLVSLLPLILFFSIRNFSEGIGITKYAMYITIASNILNIFLNWVLIYGKLGAPQMGSDGAAVATLISRVFMVIAFAALILTTNPYKQYLKYYSKEIFSIKKT
jgi:putative efflux protein, MATE family